MKQSPGQIDIFAVLDEAENGPPACQHVARGFALDADPKSDYYMEWVHSDPACRRSKFPGRKQR
jgi:hypothetical protein